MIDSMTPRERKKAIQEGRPYDRLQSWFTIEDVAAKLTGISVAEFHLNPGKQIAATVAAHQRFEPDVVETVLPAAGVLGHKMAFPEDRNPYVSETVVLEPHDLESKPLYDPKTHPIFADFWRILDGLFEKLGDKTEIGILLGGPFTAAAQAIGVDNFLKKMKKDPDYIHLLVSAVTDVQITAVRALKGYPVQFDIKDPVASGTLIKPEDYRKFVKPYQTRLLKAMKETSPNDHVLHICGNTSKILNDMAETGADIVSIDNILDLEFVKNEVGDKAAIMGNVKPTATMLLGSEEDVVQDLKLCLKKAWNTPKSYVPAFGCGLPLGTPVKNLDALYTAFRDFGRYPVDTARL